MRTVKIPTAHRRKIEGTLFYPERREGRHPAVLFLHGWGSQRQRHFLPAERLAKLGFVSLAIDLRGHGKTERLEDAVTPRDNLRDALAAYDYLVSRRDVDRDAIAMAGYSYGGFLAILVAAERKVRWLALRSPALYRDSDLDIPKASIPRRGLMAFRRRALSLSESIGLRAAAGVQADVLIIEAERDRVIPHQQIRNYLKALTRARSLVHHVIRGADHAMSREQWYHAAIVAFVQWIANKR